MILPGIWTGMCEALPLHEALEQLAAAGWHNFEVSYEHLNMILKSQDASACIALALAAKERLGLNIHQVHAQLTADVIHPDEMQREADIQLILRHFELAQKLGAGKVVIHPGIGRGMATGASARQTLNENVEAFKMLCEKADAKGLRIGVENMCDLHTPDKAGGRRFGAHPGELMDLLEKVNAPNLGITFDSSHANVQRLDLPLVIREQGASIICTHISDNDGRSDQHLAPGSGNIDWRAVAKAFRDIGFNGVFNLEVPGERHPDLSIRAAKLAHCHSVTTAICEFAELE